MKGISMNLLSKRVFKYGLLILLYGLASSSYGQCPPANGGDFEGNMTITGTCTVNGDLVLKKKDLTISPGGSLTVNGNFDNDGNGKITVNGSLLVTGDFNNNGNGKLTIDGGAVDIEGSFLNDGNGKVTVEDGAILNVDQNYTNSGNGKTKFLDGTVDVGGNFLNEGNGKTSVDGLLKVAGDFTSVGNGKNVIEGGLQIGGVGTFGTKGVDVKDGGVLQSDSLVSVGSVDIDEGGTLSVPSGFMVAMVNNDGANLDQDCMNTCCGAQCNPEGNELNQNAKNTLPVKLVSISASFDQYQNAVWLDWSTASEINNDYFTIERSHDGANYILLDYVDGAGNSQSLINYEYKDHPETGGMFYYRISQTDFDGNSEFLPVVNANVTLTILEPTVFPSVLDAGQDLNITNVWGDIETVDLHFVDLSGNGVYSIPIRMEGNNMVFPELGRKLKNGIYLLKGKVNGTPIAKKIVVRS